MLVVGVCTYIELHDGSGCVVRVLLYGHGKVLCQVEGEQSVVTVVKFVQHEIDYIGVLEGRGEEGGSISAHTAHTHTHTHTI